MIKYLLQLFCVCGSGGGVILFSRCLSKSVHRSIRYVTFLFLLLILQNNLRNLFIFCINVHTDKMLLLDKNKSLGVSFFRVI